MSQRFDNVYWTSSVLVDYQQYADMLGGLTDNPLLKVPKETPSSEDSASCPSTARRSSFDIDT